MIYLEKVLGFLSDLKVTVLPSLRRLGQETLEFHAACVTQKIHVTKTSGRLKMMEWKQNVASLGPGMKRSGKQHSEKRKSGPLGMMEDLTRKLGEKNETIWSTPFPERESFLCISVEESCEMVSSPRKKTRIHRQC